VSVRGKCHVRGTFPRAVSGWVVHAYGADAKDRVLDLLPPADADLFRANAFNSIVWYDLEPVDLFLEAASASLMGGDVAAWRALARDNFERDLGPVLRPSARKADRAARLRRAATGWSRVFDFGTMHIVDIRPASAFVRVEGFEAASIVIRYATVGTMEGLLRSGGVHDASARILAGETSFARDFEYELYWRS
jgi:hypothetical protein